MLKKGVYEHIINQETSEQIEQTEAENLVCLKHCIDEAESPQILADYLAKIIRNRLEEIENQQDRVNMINRILSDTGLLEEMQIVEPYNLLAEVMSSQQYILQKQSKSQTIRPVSGFRTSNLFTGGGSALSLGEEIRREIASADEISDEERQRQEWTDYAGDGYRAYGYDTCAGGGRNEAECSWARCGKARQARLYSS